MREIRQLLLYLAGAASLVVGILATGAWVFSEYRFVLPTEPSPHTTAVVSEGPKLAGFSSDTDSASRQPVWIEPTKKYVYGPVHVMTVKTDSVSIVTTPRAHEKRRSVRRPARINDDARRAYGSAGVAGQSQQLLILPLQHQAPN